MKQREIKFRAWSESFREYTMFYDVEMMIKEDGVWWLCNNKTRMFQQTSKTHSLMQFTGLKDKLKTDCYEGDILENPEGKRGIVVFYDGCFRLQTHKSETSSHYITMDQGYMGNKKIIGNIYEHPKLLTTKK